MKLEAIGRKLVVKLSAKEKKEGSIIIENTEGIKDRDQGVITSIGQDVMHLKEGDLVLFNQYSGKEHKIGEEDFVLLNEEEIYSKIIV